MDIIHSSEGDGCGATIATQYKIKIKMNQESKWDMVSHLFVFHFISNDYNLMLWTRSVGNKHQNIKNVCTTESIEIRLFFIFRQFVFVSCD